MAFSLRYSKEVFIRSWMRLALIIIFLLPFAIGLSLLYKALPLLEPDILSSVFLSSQWSPMQGKFGLQPFIVSSLFVAFIGLTIMLPIGLSAAIYITQFAHPKLNRILKTVVDIMAGIPSIIIGLWGILIIVPLVGDLAKIYGAENITGYSILAAGTVVAFSVMPLVLNMLLDLFESVAVELKESALSLGASHWQVVKDVILIKLKPGIIAAFSLGVSKAFGETIAVLMVVGNVIQIPSGIFEAGYPLPALLANNYGEMMTIPSYDAALMLSALLLFIIVLSFNFFSHRIIRHYKSKL